MAVFKYYDGTEWVELLRSSDISAWAKASSKPSYTLDEITDGSTRKLANYLPLAGGAMTGNISYKGTNSTTSIIKFKDNTSDAYGNGIAIGGGGIVVIGAGESSDLSYGSVGDENLYLAADTGIHFYSNAQSGLSSAKHMIFDNSGVLQGMNSIVVTHPSGGGSEYKINSTNYSLSFMIGSGDVNRGIFDHTNNTWMIYRDNTTNVYIGGAIYENGTALSAKYQAKGTYAGTAVATTSANGLMSSTDKTRLNSIWDVWSADGTDDTLVNKVEEVLTVFNNFPESSNLVELLAAKVPTSRTINSKALTDNITLTYSDVGAASSSHDHTLSIGNGPVSPTYTLNPGTSYNLNAGGKTISFKFVGDGNTCNTAGISKKASTKLYLIGSESFTYGSATDAGTTYVNDGVYVGTDNGLYVGGEKVVVTSDSRLSNARTPTAHASSATTYGVGTSSNYGHVKLGAANQNGATAADGVAAPNGHTHSQYVTSSGVTSVATSGTGLSGGTITTSGTITLDSSSAGNAAANKVVLRNAAGSIQSEKLAISSGTTTKATMQYNSTDDCIEFVFA